MKYHDFIIMIWAILILVIGLFLMAHGCHAITIKETYVIKSPHIKPTTSQQVPTATPTPKKALEPAGGISKPKINNSDIERLICQIFGEDCNVAVAVARAESGLRCNAVGDGHLDPHSYGVFQIRAFSSRPSADQLMDCETNIKWAHKMYEEQGWGPWSAYTNNRYLQFLN